MNRLKVVLIPIIAFRKGNRGKNVLNDIKWFFCHFTLSFVEFTQFIVISDAFPSCLTVFKKV